MNIRYFTLILNGLIMIGLPITLGIYLTWKFKAGWKYFWMGAATFVFSQILHIPFNGLVSPLFNQYAIISLHPTIQLLIQACFLGLSAGIFEEFARYGMYRWWAKDARDWGKGFLTGVGHGGIEAIILGSLALFIAVQIIILDSGDVSQLVPPGQMELVTGQVESVLSAPVYTTLLGAVERIFAIIIHITCSLLVLQAFIQRKAGWLWTAIAFHAFADGVVVFVAGIGFSAIQIEGVVALFALAGLGIILKLRHTMEIKVSPAIPGSIQPSEISPDS